jgi:hypothetical protein
MDDARQRAHPDSSDDRQRDLADHLARTPGDDRCSENPIGPLPDVDLDEADVLAVEDRAAHDVEWSVSRPTQPSRRCAIGSPIPRANGGGGLSSLSP